MFLNFINQYGIFFGVFIGVILGLVVAYLIFSRPTRVDVEEYPEEKDINVPFSGDNHVDSKPISPLGVEEQITEESLEVTDESENLELTEEKDLEPIKEAPKKEKKQVLSFAEDEILKYSKAIDKEDSLTEFTEEEDNDSDDEAENEDDEINIDYDQDDEDEFDDDEIGKSEEHKIVVKEVSKKAKIQTAKPERKKSELGRYHVLYRKEDNMWYVKREGSDKIVKVLHTQKEAIAFATIKSITQKTSMVIHKRDGKIRKRTY